jgi:cytoskeleton protein RodZ
MSEGIGERLREARTSRGLDLEDVEQQIRIRKRFLVAMEDEDWDVLPGSAYVRGFLHTYAELLGLDADAIVDEYRRSHRESPGAEAEPLAPAQPVATESPGVPRAPLSDRVRGPWLLVAAGIAVVLAFLLVLGLTGGDDEGGGGSPEGAAQEEPAATTTPAEEEPVEEAPPTRAKLELTAAADVWVCLLDDSGEPVIEGVTVPAGESEGPFRSRRFDITLGNGQVELVANGEPVEIAAPADPVGYRITPDAARELDEAQRPTCA